MITYACFKTNVPTNAFPAGNNVLCLQTRCDERTRQILLELDEADGSRWMYVLPVSTAWPPASLLEDSAEVARAAG